MQKQIIESFSTHCVDGVEIKGKLFIPESPKAVVQFNGGTGAKKEFYQPFLEYLTDHGYICCLWDYRGSGESAPKNLKGCDYTFRDYGMQDMPAIKKYLTSRFSDLPFFLVVHSVGGQQSGFANNLADVKGMVAIAVSTGYAPYMPFKYRVLAQYFFNVFTPLSIFFNGYLASKKLGYMEDLPKNVILEWRDWCRAKGYFFDEQFYGKTVPKGSYENMPFPIQMYSLTDDTISSERNIKNFWNHVKSDHGIKFTTYSPKEFGVKQIGHMGFFKKRFKESLWPIALAKLEEYYLTSEQ